MESIQFLDHFTFSVLNAANNVEGLAKINYFPNLKQRHKIYCLEDIGIITYDRYKQRYFVTDKGKRAYKLGMVISSFSENIHFIGEIERSIQSKEFINCLPCDNQVIVPKTTVNIPDNKLFTYTNIYYPTVCKMIYHEPGISRGHLYSSSRQISQLSLMESTGIIICDTDKKCYLSDRGIDFLKLCLVVSAYLGDTGSIQKMADSLKVSYIRRSLPSDQFLLYTPYNFKKVDNPVVAVDDISNEWILSVIQNNKDSIGKTWKKCVIPNFNEPNFQEKGSSNKNHNLAPKHMVETQSSDPKVSFILNRIKQNAQRNQNSTDSNDIIKSPRRNNKNDFTFEIIECIAVLSESNKGWYRELNIISWNGKDPVYDIRDWSPDHSNMGKGITLDDMAIGTLKRALNSIDIYQK